MKKRIVVFLLVVMMIGGAFKMGCKYERERIDLPCLIDLYYERGELWVASIMATMEGARLMNDQLTLIEVVSGYTKGVIEREERKKDKKKIKYL